MTSSISWYMREAELLYGSGQYEEARQLLSAAIDAIKREFPTQSEESTAFVLQALATVLIAQGNYDEAEALFDRAINLLRTNNCGALEMEALLLSNLANLCVTTGQYSRAEALLLDALEICMANDRLKSELGVAVLNNLAECFVVKGDYRKAEQILTSAVAMDEELIGVGSRLAIDLNNLGKVYAEQQCYTDAERVLNQALEMIEPTHPILPTILNNLASVARAKGDVTAFADLLRRALSLVDKSDPLLGVLLANLADAAYETGDFCTCEKLYRDALSALHASVGLSHPDAAFVLGCLARLNLRRMQYQDAESLCNWAQSIFEELGQWNSASALSVLFDSAAVYHARRQFHEAETLYSRIIESIEQTRGHKHVRLLPVLTNLAWLFKQSKREPDCDKTIDRILSIIVDVDADSVEQVIETLGDLANLRHEQERYAESKQLYEQASNLMDSSTCTR